MYGYDTAAGGAPVALSTTVPFAPPAGAPIAVDGDIAYFAAADAEHGMELWSTDGTAAGTALAEDLTDGPVSSFPAPLGVGSNAPVLTTDTPDDGTVVVRLGDTRASPPDGDDGDDPPAETTPTDTTTTTTTTTQTHHCPRRRRRRRRLRPRPGRRHRLRPSTRPRPPTGAPSPARSP